MLRPASVVCWKWAPPPGYRSAFGPETVNTLARMVKRHYSEPVRFICVTDDGEGIDPSIEIVPAWNDFASLGSPHGRPDRYPSCYRRLRAYHPDAGTWFGPRFVTLDLDCVVTGDLRPIFHRQEDFVIWGDTNPTTLYNASITLMTAGCRSQVWTTFDPETSPGIARAARHHGSDQAWISYCLGPGEARFSRQDGIYSYRNEIAPTGRGLPSDARLVMFHGCFDPWEDKTRAIAPWVREHWC